jgi:hypothetical protein
MGMGIGNTLKGHWDIYVPSIIKKHQGISPKCFVMCTPQSLSYGARFPLLLLLMTSTVICFIKAWVHMAFHIPSSNWACWVHWVIQVSDRCSFLKQTSALAKFL